MRLTEVNFHIRFQRLLVALAIEHMIRIRNHVTEVRSHVTKVRSHVTAVTSLSTEIPFVCRWKSCQKTLIEMSSDVD